MQEPTEKLPLQANNGQFTLCSLLPVYDSVIFILCRMKMMISRCISVVMGKKIICISYYMSSLEQYTLLI